ncbi:hypothetical protein AgCh_024097 [Apium graveolens]
MAQAFSHDGIRSLWSQGEESNKFLSLKTNRQLGLHFLHHAPDSAANFGVIVKDSQTQKSLGYGFMEFPDYEDDVTMDDSKAADRAAAALIPPRPGFL